MGRPPRYSEEFRQEAVRLVESGRPLKQIAAELGVSPAALRDWRRQVVLASAKGAVGTKVGVSRLEEENRRLRRENERLREEREILKKATAFFAKDAR
jgi:transposase